MSTPGLKLYSSGAADTRVDKTDYISDFSIAQDNLMVCCLEDENCGTCLKCKRTLITLDVLGKVDLFAKSFNLGEYNKNRISFFKYLLTRLDVRDEYYEQIFAAFRERDPKNAERLYRREFNNLFKD
jgi:hypothetical protein